MERERDRGTEGQKNREVDRERQRLSEKDHRVSVGQVQSVYCLITIQM